MLSPSWDFFTEIKEPCVKPQYSESFRLIERMHRQFLEVVKSELDRLGIQDINSVQGLILYNIGDEELTVGELTTRGYYLGSNVSYNVRKMVENGYLMQHRSTHDRRSIRVKLSPRGLDLYQKMDQLIIDDAVIIPLYYDEVVRLVSNKIKGLGNNSMNLLNLKTVKKQN
jgi:DNA-binding MarR family transcriptional regulator